MNCKVVNLEPLPNEEALQLFLNKVGNVVLSADGVIKKAIKPTLEKIVKECGGLPLLIVTIASSMTEISSSQLWENALEELRNRKRTVASTRTVEGTKNDAFEILKFSFDRLNDEKIQYCFLYCALYPEDFAIRKRKLIECWIEEGFIAPMETRHKMNCQGHAILRKLEDNCLLETVQTWQSRVIDDEDERAVKMHDLLRAMALDITSNSPRFLVKYGMNIRELPNKEQWTEDLNMVSLIRNSIEEIPRDLSSPECRMLTTLLLSRNNLSNFPDSFFEQMNELKIIDLSKNYELKSLPSSISKLKNLTTLLLISCRQLRQVPNLSNCQAITKLDFDRSGIEEIPEGMDMLINLKYLNLNHTEIRRLPKGIFKKLSSLQILALRIKGVQVKGEDLWPLEKLEYFNGVLIDWNELSIFFKMMQGRGERLRNYRLCVGTKGEEKYQHRNFWKRSFEISCLPIAFEKGVFLPHNVETIILDRCLDFKYLDQVSFLNDKVNLTACFLIECQGIEFAFSSLLSFNPLQTLQYLWLEKLENLKSLFEEEALAPSALSFPLKTIFIKNCPKIKRLFSPRLLVRHLQNLESICVGKCEELEQIIASEEYEEEDGTLPLPKLKILTLGEMPKLKSICSRTRVLVCDSLETLLIDDCPMLKRVPLSPPPSLKEIKVSSKESWESLEWEHPNAKDILLPFVEFDR